MKKTPEQVRVERGRGWIIKTLNDARPDPVELAVLSSTLDGLNFPMWRRTLAQELDYLRSLGLVRVFPLGSDEEHTAVDQAKLIQRYANSNSDADLGASLCVRVTAHGIDFQAGLVDGIAGVMRVE